MKKLILSLSLVAISFVGVQAQCTPDFTVSVPGLYPTPSTFACAEQGVNLTGAVLTIKNFNTAGPGGSYTIDSLLIDSVSNVPCGISYAIKYPNNRALLNNEAACINFTGVTADPAGQYQMKVYGKVYGTPDIPLGIEGNSKDLSSIGSLNSPPLDFRYWLRVKAAGGTCAALDTATGSSANKISSCNTTVGISNVNTSIQGITIFPNPAQSNVTLSFDADLSENYSLMITNLIGSVVYSGEVSVSAGDNQVKLDVSSFAKGNYIITLKHLDKITAIRFVVQ